MSAPLRSIVALVFLTVLAGALGGWGGVIYGEQITHPRGNLDTLVHQELNLSAQQNARIEVLERRYATRSKDFKAQMLAANRELADALDREHTFGPQALAAVNRFHQAEKALQIATIEHVLAMRAVLTPEQKQKFDRAIHQALTRT